MRKLTLLNKLAFGAGDLGTAMTAGILGFFRLIFLTDVAGLDPALAGFVIMIGRLWDAFNDPLIGTLSDRLRTRWGRRRPMMLAGSLPMAIGYVLMFLVPSFDTTGKVIYYIVASFIFDTAYTIVNVPYTALNAEMTDDYNERTSLNAYRFSFSILGTLAALIIHTMITGTVKPAQAGYATAAMVLGVLIFLPYIFAFFGTFERGINVTEEQMPFVQGLRHTFANRAFLWLVGIYLSSWLALQIAQTMFSYYLTYWLGIRDQLPVLASIQISSFVGLAIWSQVSKRIGKKKAYLIGAALWIVIMIVLFFVPQNTPQTTIVIIGVIAGLCLSIAYLIPWAMLPDVVTLDELNTGKRREGIYYGYFALLQKLGGAVASWLIGIALSAASYRAITDGSGALQPQSALTMIRVLIAFAPLVVLLIGMWCAARFPITQQQHEQNLRALKAKQTH